MTAVRMLTKSFLTKNTFQTAASPKELEQYHREAQIWLNLLEEEAKQGENLKEDDFRENKVTEIARAPEPSL